MKTYHLIKIECRADVCCVRLRHTRLEEMQIQELGDELLALCNEDGCRKIALSLGPEPPDCLYSVFLAKLVSLRNATGARGRPAGSVRTRPDRVQRLRGLLAAPRVYLRSGY